MLSTTKGDDIAKLYKKDGKKKPKVQRTIKIYDDNFTEEPTEENQEMKITNKDEFFFPVPRKHSERIYVSAPSGSGKSTWIGNYLTEIRKAKGGKKREIFLFSRVEEDKPLDKHNPVRIPLERSTFDTDPLQPEDFENSVVIFDDIDTLMDKPLLKYLQEFRDDLLECGRHYGITTISTTHQILNFRETRKLLNEANAVVIFPRSNGAYQIRIFLEKYMGFEKDQIEMVKRLPSRWVYLWKEFPQYLIYEKGIKINKL